MTRYSTVLMMHVYLYKYTYKRIIMTPLHHLYIALNLSTIDISVGNQFIFTVAPFSCHLIEKWVPPSPLPFEAWTAFVNLLLTCTLRKKNLWKPGSPHISAEWLDNKGRTSFGYWVGCKIRVSVWTRLAWNQDFKNQHGEPRFGFCIIWKSYLKATLSLPSSNTFR